VQQQPTRGLRHFFGTRLGRVLLIAITIVVVWASYVYEYAGAILAIPVFLIFGLAIPIWAGLKRPRYLAIAGLVVVLIVAPMTTLILTEEVRTPIGAACSASSQACPGSTADALLQNASVSPYTGTTSTNFTWTVWIYPQYIPSGNFTVANLSLYVSTCPGATSGSSPPSWCSSGYPFHQITFNLTSLNLSLHSSPIEEVFHFAIGSNGIWDWQMGVYTLANSTRHPWFATLVGDPTYNGLEGPVVGDFSTTYFSLLGTIYFDTFLFLAGPFYLVLLVYMVFKARERRRKDAAKRAAGPVPPAGGEGAAEEPKPGGALSSPSPPAAGPPPPPGPPERTCPNCGAVVYENETKCWKCGASLVPASSTPLPSDPVR